MTSPQLHTSTRYKPGTDYFPYQNGIRVVTESSFHITGAVIHVLDISACGKRAYTETTSKYCYHGLRWILYSCSRFITIPWGWSGFLQVCYCLSTGESPARDQTRSVLLAWLIAERLVSAHFLAKSWVLTYIDYKEYYTEFKKHKL